MFSYPINRKKMMASKLAITAIVTFITVIVSNILVVGIFFGIDSYFSILPHSFTVDQLVQEGIKLVPLAIATAGMSLILYISECVNVQCQLQLFHLLSLSQLQ